MTQNSSNQDYQNNADGAQIAGGTVKRILKWLGANITLTGSGTNTYTFPASSDTLLGRDSTDTVTGKSMSGSSNTFSNIPASALDSSAIGQGFLEIGRTTLGSPGDTITVSSLPARKYLRVIVFCADTGGTISAAVTFNNDTGSNYANRRSDNGGADATATSTTSIAMVNAVAQNFDLRFEVENTATLAKIPRYSATGEGANGAGNAPNKYDGSAKWHNTSDQITRIDVTNAGTGDFNTGSQIIVLAKD